MYVTAKSVLVGSNTKLRALLEHKGLGPRQPSYVPYHFLILKHKIKKEVGGRAPRCLRRRFNRSPEHAAFLCV